MKANELRIGNCVKTKINGLGIVEAISGTKILYSRNYDSLDIEYFEPIPLTEKWYLDSGFKKDSYGNFNISINKDFLLLETMRVGDEWCVFIVKKNNTEECCSLYRIKYVHQLQNLYFSLTNKELTIK